MTSRVSWSSAPTAYGSAEADTLVLGGEVAQRVCDVAGVKSAGRDLVQQRLEGVVRVPIDEGHPEPFLGQLVGRCYAGEAGAQYHHMRHLGHGNIQAGAPFTVKGR